MLPPYHIETAFGLTPIFPRLPLGGEHSLIDAQLHSDINRGKCKSSLSSVWPLELCCSGDGGGHGGFQWRLSVCEVNRASVYQPDKY